MEQNDKNEGAANSQMSVLYKDRTDWKDVEPIYNSPEENAVCRIATTEEFDDAFAYLRAVLNSNEFSERTLELTKTCIFLNAANYSVWEFRRQILRALGSNIQEELNYCGEVITENPKNYQVWHHRKTLIGDFDGVNLDGELEFVAFQLQDEPKNYHAWQYRQWLVEHFNLYSLNEINFSTECLLEDIRNNSAWNYRYFIGANLSECFKPEKFLQSEIDFTLACIRKAPSNESAWSYLSGILLNDQLGPDRPEIVKCCEELLARSPPCHSSHLRIFLIDSIVERLRNGVEDEQKLNEYLGKANQHLDILEQIDPIRHNFWVYKRNYLHNLFSP